ncbi:MAG TPA: response regulator [Nitrospira sp.]|nr:response regulator [Nitrospira sp.]
MSHPITSLVINYEDDVVTARQRARQVAAALTFEEQDRTRIATAVSEIARIFVHRNKLAHVDFSLEGDTVPQVLIVRIVASRTGLSKQGTERIGVDGQAGMEWERAITSARRLMDQCEVGGQPDEGAVIRLKKLLPKRAGIFTGAAVGRLSRQIDRQPQNPMEEVRQQNQELLRALEELHERQQELIRLNRELEDTNRGVVALYAELDEQAGHLRRADDMKSRFLSNMSHEFRTPLNAILALSQLLLDRTDGALTEEQERQVRFIRHSGEDLLELVNDLLDLAKIQAGKIEIRPAEFEVANLFSALRGMLRPMVVSSQVNLIFDEPAGIPPMNNDEGKISQILRNFISNAIKFTERGEIRVSARLGGDGTTVIFWVADTGIGIAEGDQARIFEEFTQLEHPIQKKVKGTGLGLPLCRKLAGLLSGSVGVKSALGAGSTFTATIPIVYRQTDEAAPSERVDRATWQADGNRLPVLVVEDEPDTRLLYEKFLRRTAFQPMPAATIRQARELLRLHRVAAIVLDILLPDESAWQWLAELKKEDATKHVPVLIVSSVEDPRKGLALGAEDYCVKPVRREWLLERLERATGRRTVQAGAVPIVLIIDDQEADRYILARQIAETGWSIVEAASGEEGIALAGTLRPALILLDLNMPGMDGLHVLEGLRDDPATSEIPVAVVTSLMPLPQHDVRLSHAREVLEKTDVSPATIRRLIENARQRQSPYPTLVQGGADDR